MPTMAEFGSVCSVSKNPDCLYDVNWFLKCYQSYKLCGSRLYIQVSGRVCLSEQQGTVLYLKIPLDAIFKKKTEKTHKEVFWV